MWQLELWCFEEAVWALDFSAQLARCHPPDRPSICSLHQQPLLPSSSVLAHLINKMLGLLPCARPHVDKVPKTGKSNPGPAHYLFPKKCVRVYFRAISLLFGKTVVKEKEAGLGSTEKKKNRITCSRCLFSRIERILQWFQNWGAGPKFLQLGPRGSLPFSLGVLVWPCDASPHSPRTQAASFAHG